MDKRLYPTFPMEGNLGITKHHRSITLSSIAYKVYNILYMNRIKPEIEKILWKNQNYFWRNRLTTSQILNILRIIERVRKNILRHHCSSYICPRYLIPHTEGR